MDKSQDDALTAAIEDYRRAYCERFGSYERFLKTRIEGDVAVITMPAKPLADGTPSGMHTPIRAQLEMLLELTRDLRTK